MAGNLNSIYRRKVFRAFCFAAVLVCPIFLASLVVPVEVSGSTSGNHFTITNEAGAISYYGWFLEPILPISKWDFGVEELAPVSKDDWDSVSGMLGLDFVLHLNSLEAAVPYWLVAGVLFLVFVSILFTLPPHAKHRSEQADAGKPNPATS